MPAMPEHSFPPRIYPHVLWVWVHAGLTSGWGVALYATVCVLPSVWNDGFVFSFILGLGLFLALLFWLSAAAFCRRLSLLFRHPELSLSSGGIRIRCYRNGFRTLFKPWYIWQGQLIAWSDFRGCRVERVGFGDFLLLRKSLVVAAAASELEVTWGMFKPRVERLQREILDYYQLTVLAPDKEEVRVPEFLRRLFQAPVVFASPRLGRNEIFLSILILPVVGAYLVLRLAPDYGLARPLAGYAVFVGVAVPVAILVTRAWIRATRFIQLSADGISIGPDAASARLIPWHGLAFARVHQFGSQPSH